MLAKAAEAVEMTESQMAVIEYLEDIGHHILCGAETYTFDIRDIPWDKNCVSEDIAFLQKMIGSARQPETMEKLYFYMWQPAEIICPLLEQFSELLEGMSYDAAEDGTEKTKVFFKKGSGWKVCRDENRKIYTAEYGARGYYKLYEIAREAYDKLVREIVDEETAVDLIREGRILFETDEDANGRGYCIVHDEKYQELAPWSSAKRKYECIYGRYDAVERRVPPVPPVSDIPNLPRV